MDSSQIIRLSYYYFPTFKFFMIFVDYLISNSKLIRIPNQSLHNIFECKTNIVEPVNGTLQQKSLLCNVLKMVEYFRSDC